MSCVHVHCYVTDRCNPDDDKKLLFISKRLLDTFFLLRILFFCYLGFNFTLFISHSL